MIIVTKNLQTGILPQPRLHLLRQVVKGGVVIIESVQTRVLLCFLAGCCCSLEMFIGGDLLKEGFGAPRRSRRNKASILSSSLAGLLWQWPTPGLNITQCIRGDWIHEENIAAKADYEVVEDLIFIVGPTWQWREYSPKYQQDDETHTGSQRKTKRWTLPDDEWTLHGWSCCW